MSAISKFINRMRGYYTFKIITVDIDGDVRFRKMRVYPTGQMICRAIGGFKKASSDGSFECSSYVKKWERI